jgi:FAD/FMN-containing dehydrogenase
MTEQISRPTTAPTAPVTLDLDALRSVISGRVIGPGDEGYDAARVVTMGGVDARPAVIVRVAGPDDVRAVLDLARSTGLPLAVRSGGHSGAAHSTVEGGIVLDVRDLRGLEVDVANRTAWVGSGLTAGEVTTALAEHGLALGFGDTGSVGVGGITLGGGIGFLARKHGLTIDSLLAVELVTAAGELVLADATTHPDLFWAVRGGGGNFGVATRFRFRVHPLAQVVGGMLILPATDAVIAGFMEASAAAPDELSVIANVMPCPPMPFVPEERHGEIVVFALVCWSGSVEEADAVLAPLRSLATPLADLLQPIPYPGLFHADDSDYHPLAVAQTLFMDGVDLADARRILAALQASDAPMRVVQLRPLRGAIARVDRDATAYAHRDRAVMANVAAFLAGPEDREAREAWVRSLADALRDGPAAYVNFLGDEGPGRVRDAYPDGTWERLVAVKRRYDPDNLFRRNQNVDPSAA